MPQCSAQEQTHAQSTSHITRHASNSSHRPRRVGCLLRSKAAPRIIPSQVADIEEPAALSMLRNYRTTDIEVAGVPVPVQACFVGPRPPGDASASTARESTPILLVHGFDSSAVEWRRVFQQLAATTDTYALDIFGCAGHTLIKSVALLHGD